MRTAKRTLAFKARGLRAGLIAAAIGLAPLAASTAATPADGALPLEASAVSVEVVPRVPAPLPEETASAPTALPRATSLGRGSASYYASKFHGRRTASGEAFDNTAMTAAHRTLPFGSLVRVTNPATGASVIVRINDRGPFSRGRLIDVSRAAAEELGMIARGHATVELELIEG
ncbi:septal ring lytic transglycosylase RlpA family protein [Erythrobacter tepidarius]|uniref:septal ring lytic transglycosylase RlpA family protein n=1 Tax=Erythrobacter tepidarius TaxID=60454 RepID=UPI000A3981BD|nr:septal ring lytic transglycosylase RlpA family protein [Erythrobacter tepidarius]